jgi:hypothetical protein
MSLTQDSFKKSWEGVANIIVRDEFAAAVRRYIERC